MPTITIVVSRRYPVKATPNDIERRCLLLLCALPTLYKMSNGRSEVPSRVLVGVDDEPYYVCQWTMLPPFKCTRHFHHNILRHSTCGAWRVVGKVVRCGNQYTAQALAHIQYLLHAYLGPVPVAVQFGRSQTLLRSRNLPIAQHVLAYLNLSWDLS
jgi:hypothetical protein